MQIEFAGAGTVLLNSPENLCRVTNVGVNPMKQRKQSTAKRCSAMRYVRVRASVCTNLDGLSYNLDPNANKHPVSAKSSKPQDPAKEMTYLRTSMVSRKHNNVMLRHRI